MNLSPEDAPLPGDEDENPELRAVLNQIEDGFHSLELMLASYRRHFYPPPVMPPIADDGQEDVPF